MRVKPDIDPSCRGIGLIRRIRRDPLAFFLDLGTRSGSYAWMSLMGSPVLFLNDARAIEYVFNHSDQKYHKGKYNESLRPLLGNGVFLSEGDLWRKQRRHCAPVFAGGNFPEFTTRIVEATQAMLKRWEPKVARGDAIDMSAEMMNLTLDVVLRALFHEDSEEDLMRMQEVLGTMLRMAEGRIWSIANLPLWLTLRLPRYARTMKFLHALTEELIDRRRADKAYPEDLLSRLIDCHGGNKAEKDLLRDNVLSFLLAGNETTANGLAWTFYELGHHPQILQRVREEVDLLTAGAPPTLDIVRKMDYTRQSFCEAMRLYPPIWTMSRRALVDDVLPLDDGGTVHVPKNATVMLCTYSVQRREKYWPDPDVFRPERFTQAEIAKRPKSAWFPFGGGPRLCLGYRFAEVESIIALAMVYQKYDLTLLSGQQIRPEPIITLRPDRPVLFRAVPRRGFT